MEGFEWVYDIAGKEHRGFAAIPAGDGMFPVVLISHAWNGRDDNMCKKALRLAAQNYVALALDNYGEGRVGKSRAENSEMMVPLKKDRDRLKRVLLAGFESAKRLPKADPARVAIIGYCFGGLCALDLARTGAELRGAVSFHGLLDAPKSVVESLNVPAIRARVLVLHGYDDPMVVPDQVTEFAKEMTDRRVDWQIHMYGNCVHGFTNPAANDPAFGTVYNVAADCRSWLAMTNFLEEIFEG